MPAAAADPGIADLRRWGPPVDPPVREGHPRQLTIRGRHIGNGFPRLTGLPIKENRVTWPRVHMFRLEDELVVEHWAVRDDATMLDSVTA